MSDVKLLSPRIDNQGIWAADHEKPILSYPEGDYDVAFELEDHSFWFQFRNQAIRVMIQRFLPDGDFADIGRENGFQSADLFKVFSLKRRSFIALMNPDSRSDQKEVFKGVLNSSLIYFSVPAYSFLWSDVEEYSQHHRRYNHRMIVELAKNSDLDLIYNGSIFSFLLPFTFLLRVIPYRLKGRKADEKILQQAVNNHNQPSLLDRIFTLIGRGELFLLRFLKLPFGTSRMAILRVKS